MHTPALQRQALQETLPDYCLYWAHDTQGAEHKGGAGRTLQVCSLKLLERKLHSLQQGQIQKALGGWRLLKAQQATGVFA